MKKLLKALCILLVVILLGLGSLAIWQKDNLVSYVNSKIYSQDELTAQISDKKEEIASIVNSYTDVKIRDFTAEEEKQILRGEVTPDEVFAKILKESGIDYEQWKASNDANNSSEPGDENPVEQSPAPQNETNENSADQIINQYVPKMYNLKAQYLGKLSGLRSEVISYYNSLPKESHNSAGKEAAASKFLGEFSSLEAECDSKVYDLLNSFEAQLKSVNGDLSIINSMKKAYADEKNLTKAYYINLYR